MNKILQSFRSRDISKEKQSELNDKSIAIVGMTCRFPGSETLEEFWTTLCEEKFCIQDGSAKELPFRFFKSLPKHGGFLSDIDLFDPEYFSIAPQESTHIDPLTRQVLLLIPKLMENAGYSLEEVKGKSVGIFIGARAANYSEKIASFNRYSIVGLGQNYIAAYASQIFDFQGPNLVVDSACSSSLLSVHLACKSLEAGECDIAIAGGADLLLDEKPFDLLMASGALSAKGKCAFFDGEADGIALGEGAGLVLLKRHADALNDNDVVAAVIEGSAVNNDGRTMGVTTPNPDKQEQVIRSAIQKAGIDPKAICYIEAHGTGTMIGDPLELQALSRVFSKNLMERKRVGVGSVKSNIGHLLSAAGIASLIKVVLSLQHKTIPPSINCTRKNPRFLFEDSAFDLIQTLTPMDEREGYYRAGVSAFGFGGTNVHMVLRNSKQNIQLKKSGNSLVYNLRSFWPNPSFGAHSKPEDFSKNDFVVTAAHPLLCHHLVQGRPIIPGVTYLSWMTAKLTWNQALASVIFEHPFSLEKNDSAKLEMIFHSDDGVMIKSVTSDAKKEAIHLRSKLVRCSPPDIPEMDIKKFKTESDKVVLFEELYEYASSVGIVHGQFFKNSGQAYINKDRCLLEIHLPFFENRNAFMPFETTFDPALLDGSTFAFIALFFPEFKKITETFIPLTISQVHLFGTPTKINYAYVQKNSLDHLFAQGIGETYRHDIVIYNDNGKPIAFFKEVVGKKIREQKGIKFPLEKSAPAADLVPIFAQEIGVSKSFDLDKPRSDKAVTSHRTPNFLLTESTPSKGGQGPAEIPKSFLLKKIKKSIPTLDLQSIEENQKFYEMGLDSKDLLKIVSDLEKEFSLALYPTLLFEYDTVPALETFLVQHIDLDGLENTENKSEECQRPKVKEDEPIAIIGLYGEYGPCQGMPAFWQTLQEGVDCIKPVSEKRLSLWGISADNAQGYVGSWMEDIDMFEPGTCRLSPRELEGMDPQERKFLDCVQGCLEDANYSTKALSPTNKVGVFVGAMYGHYELFGQENSLENNRIPNSSFASIANRVSYLMNWQGPSIAVDTMCSSSLTAIHLACASLRHGECEAAIAGGVNIHSHSQKYHWLKDTHFLSLNGRCRSFGQREEDELDGYVPGEGVGAILLKPLSRAQKDGDYIWGVILGSALNHGGLSGGYTVPTPKAQQEVIEEAVKQAGIDKNQISYIEAHGTGTSLGDPIEIRALQAVFQGVPHTISIGSVKSNIGHLESAAGMAGLTKILLQMHHEALVPSLHSIPSNPYIDFSKIPFRIQQTYQPWETPLGHPLTAGLSAFGAGGSNAHLIVQQYKGNNFTKILSPRKDRTSKMKSFWVSRPASTVTNKQPSEYQDPMRIYRVDWQPYLVEAFKNDTTNCLVHFFNEEQSRPLFGMKYLFDLEEISNDIEQLITLLELTENELQKFNEINRFIFDTAKKLISLNRPFCWSIVVCVEKFKDQALLLSYLGFLKTISLEHAFLKSKIVFVNKETLPFAFEYLMQKGGIQQQSPHAIHMEKGEYKVLEIDPLSIASSPALPPQSVAHFPNRGSKLKKHGTYLITGGLGGIGQVICQYLVSQWQANICIIGRSPPDQEKQNVMQHWKTLGSDIAYIQGNICDYNVVEKAVSTCLERFNALNGIIHSAGVMRLRAFAEQSWDDFCSIADPKIKGLMNLDRATVNVPLDFFANFSSHSALLGISQGSDYAFANAFLMAFTDWRENLAAKGQRYGSTLGFLWPRWKEGGLKASDAVLRGLEKWLWHEQGMRLLSNEVGTKAFDAIMKMEGSGNFLIGEGDAAKMDKFLKKAVQGNGSSKDIFQERPLDTFKRDIIKVEDGFHNLEKMLQSLLMSILKIDPEDLNPSFGWSEHGFDSISLKEFTDRINAELNVNILPPILFGYGTISELSTYLLSTYDHLKTHFKQSQDDRKQTLVQPCRMGSAKNFEFKDEDIVVVGMECHFPLSNTLNAFWDNIERDISFIRKRPDKSSKLNTEAGFIEDPDLFDAPFFNISEEEAQMMDPQQRLLLMLCYHLFESSGLPPSKLSNKAVGVFVGAQFSDYYNILRNLENSSLFVATGNAKSFIANRLSYYFNFNGPSEVIDTACSSSLVAVHHAIQSIQTGESLFALAGGVSLMLDPIIQSDTEKLGVISPSGRCKTFDKDADGYVRSEGLAMVLLTTFKEAKRYNLPTHAKILACGVNHGGKASSLAAPNLLAQKNLIKSVFSQAQIDPATLGYMEAHGTGTELGDPIEIQAIQDAFHELNPSLKENTAKANIHISSIKTRLGHLEPASGIAGFLTAVLSLKHKKIPGNWGLSTLNPYIKLEKSPFQISSKTSEWTDRYSHDGLRMPRRCSVSSFGFSGTNSFLIMEEYTSPPRQGIDDYQELPFPLSAKSEKGLKNVLLNLIKYLQQNQPLDLSRISYTLCLGRAHFAHRSLVFANSPSDLLDKLHACVNDEEQIFKHKEHELYLKGHTVNWDDYFKAFSRIPLPIELPVYPFEKKSYWFDTQIRDQRPQERVTEKAVPNNQIEYQTLQVLWKQTEIPLKTVQHPVRIGIFGTGEFIGWQDALKDIGIACTFFKATGCDIDPGNFDEIWLPFLPLSKHQELSSYIENLSQTCSQLTGLLKKAKSTSTFPKIKFMSFADDLAPDVDGFCQTDEAGILSFFISLQHELCHLSLHLFHTDSRAIANPSHDLLRTYAFLPSEFNVVMLWNNCTYTPAFHETPLSPLEKPAIKQKGTYLIAGGTGPVGHILSQYLSRRYQANIVIVSRGVQPSSKLEQLSNTVESYGGAFYFVKADITNQKQINEAIFKATCRFGNIDGLFILASDHFEKGFIECTHGDIQQALQAKVIGTRSILKALEKSTLDFLCIFSSAQVALPAGHRSLYALACGIQNQLSHQAARTCRFPIKIVNWGFWTQEESQKNEILSQIGIIPLTKEAGMDLMEKALRYHGNHLLIGDFKQAVSNPSCLKLHSQDQATVNKATSELLEALREVLAALLNVKADALPIDKPFTDLGVDSLIGISFIQKLNQACNLKLSKTIIYQKKTLSELAKAIMRHLSEQKKSNGFVIHEPAKNPTTEVIHSKTPRSGEKQVDRTFGPKNSGDIAIIGFSGRFPQADNVEDFWENICANKDCLKDISQARWYQNYLQEKQRNSTSEINCLRGGFLDNISDFAAEFFEISSAEALVMDPQQRIFLECAWNALEKAGYAQRYSTPCNFGIFVGAEPSDYKELLHKEGAFYHSHTLMGNSEAILASRLAYFLNSQGPTLTINTACSSSLVSIHMACESLRNGGCELAIAGGVSIFVTPEPYVILSKIGMLSKTSSCNPFSDHANGFVPSEAVGVVILKPYEDAFHDGDTIHAVIKGSGINQDGRSNGITAPNGEAQAELIKSIYTKNNIDPTSIGYVETHGTGTALGDPIEFQALSTAFRSHSLQKHYCALGAVKGMMGHSFAASGVVGLIKALLVLKQDRIPKALIKGNFNQEIDLTDSPFYFAESENALPQLQGTKRVAVSSFGFSGTNAHIVLEKPPAAASPQTTFQEWKYYLIPISSYYPEGVSLMVAKLKNHLLGSKENGKLNDDVLINLMYTLGARRMHGVYRYGFVVRSVDDLLDQIQSFADAPKEILDVLQKDSHFKKMIQLYAENTLNSIRKEKNNGSHWQALAYAYSQGGIIPWEILFEQTAAKLIDIPTCPLKKQTFWPQSEKQNTKPSQSPSPFTLEVILEDIYNKQEMPAPEALAFLMNQI